MMRWLNFYLALIDNEEDREKFEKLYRKFERMMYGKAMSLVRHKELAEDALHDAFTYVAEHMEKIDDPESDRTKALLTMVVNHKAYDILRKERVREKHHADFEEAEEVADPNFEDFTGNDALALALKSLGEEYRTAVVFRYLYKYTAKDIAALMNCTVSKAEKLVSRGKKLLQEAYLTELNRDG